MHAYESKCFTIEQEEIIRSTAGNSKCFENFLTQDEFDFCRKLISSPINWPEHGQVSKYWGFDWSNGLGPELIWLKEKIDAILPDWKLDFLAVQEAINPWRIHADIRWYADKLPYKVMLLPMDVEPNQGPVDPDSWSDTYTIAFDQYNFLSKQNNGTSQTGNTQTNWQRAIDNPSTENIQPGFHIDRSQHEQFFSHLDYQELEGLTIEAIHQWKPRSLFMWDNTALHCADNFLKNNIKTKRSLMIFTLYNKI
jgi:hypothetical protein